MLVFALAAPVPGAIPKLSLGSAYAGGILLVVVLCIGPIRFLNGQSTPASIGFRRDLAIWSGVFAILHVGAGLLVHFGGRIWPYFIVETGAGLGPRLDPFGMTNYAGLACAVFILVLTAISNDAAMRTLGLARWRKIQGVSPWVGFLVFAHAAIYQLLERREPLLVVVVVCAFAIAASLRFARQIKRAR